MATKAPAGGSARPPPATEQPPSRSASRAASPSASSPGSAGSPLAALLGRFRRPPQPPPPPLTFVHVANAPAVAVADDAAAAAAAVAAAAAAAAASATATDPLVPPRPVTLHIYDVDARASPGSIPALNALLYPFGLGIYHTGVAIGAVEYFYAGADAPGPGVCECTPRGAPDAVWRAAVEVAGGGIRLSAAAEDDVLDALAIAFPARGYDLLTRNCNTFSGALLQALGVGGTTSLPRWVNRLAGLGEAVRCLLPKTVTAPMGEDGEAAATAAAAAAAKDDAAAANASANGATAAGAEGREAVAAAAAAAAGWPLEIDAVAHVSPVTPGGALVGSLAALGGGPGSPTPRRRRSEVPSPAVAPGVPTRRPPGSPGTVATSAAGVAVTPSDSGGGGNSGGDGDDDGGSDGGASPPLAAGVTLPPQAIVSVKPVVAAVAVSPSGVWATAADAGGGDSGGSGGGWGWGADGDEAV